MGKPHHQQQPQCAVQEAFPEQLHTVLWLFSTAWIINDKAAQGLPSFRDQDFAPACSLLPHLSLPYLSLPYLQELSRMIPQSLALFCLPPSRVIHDPVDDYFSEKTVTAKQLRFDIFLYTNISVCNSVSKVKSSSWKAMFHSWSSWKAMLQKTNFRFPHSHIHCPLTGLSGMAFQFRTLCTSNCWRQANIEQFLHPTWW